MVCPRAAHTGQNIERDFPIGLRVLDFGALVRCFGGRVVSALVFEGPWRLATKEVGLEAGVEDAAVEAERVVEAGAHVADFFELFPDGAFAQGVLVIIQENGAGVGVGGEGGIGGLSGEHAAAHGSVGAFDFRDVEEAGGVANERTAREGASRDGLKAAFVEGAGAVGDAFAAFDNGFVEGVMF